MVRIELRRAKGDFGFEAKDAFGHKAHMDTSPETGGQDYGIRPMQMLLMGLGGCSGIDIASILKKQRQTISDFRLIIDGEREKGKDPSLWETIHVVIRLKGDIDPDKAKKACELSMDKYCSVAATLRPGHTKITWEVKVND